MYKKLYEKLYEKIDDDKKRKSDLVKKIEEDRIKNEKLEVDYCVDIIKKAIETNTFEINYSIIKIPTYCSPNVDIFSLTKTLIKEEVVPPQGAWIKKSIQNELSNGRKLVDILIILPSRTSQET